MKQQHTLQPKLRFPEFDDSYKNVYLKDIAKFYKGKNISKADIIEDGAIECIRYGELYTTYGEVIDKIVSKTNLDKKNLVFSEANDIIIPASGESAIDIATASCVIKEGVALGGDLNIIKTKENGVFLSYYFNNKKKYEIAKKSQGISVIHIYSDHLKSLNLNIPSLPEQQKIADYLSTIDNKINLLEEKKAQLALYKKAMMQKLFSQEIRFKPSEAEALEAYPEWEEKRLGEIGFFQTSSIDKLSRENEKEVFLINYMNVYRHEKIDKLSIVNYQKVTAKDAQIISCNIKKGDILFTPSSETPSDIGHSVVIFEDIENAVFSYHLMRFRSNIKLDLKYSHYFCNIPKVLNQLSKYATGSTRFTISVKSFANVIVDIPCYEEQQKIADFLSAIDESIEKVNEQITQTQSFKKAMLQQMFV